jgi:hypothetical protein
MNDDKFVMMSNNILRGHASSKGANRGAGSDTEGTYWQ